MRRNVIFLYLYNIGDFIYRAGVVWSVCMCAEGRKPEYKIREENNSILYIYQ